MSAPTSSTCPAYRASSPPSATISCWRASGKSRRWVRTPSPACIARPEHWSKKRVATCDSQRPRARSPTGKRRIRRSRKRWPFRPRPIWRLRRRASLRRPFVEPRRTRSRTTMPRRRLPVHSQTTSPYFGISSDDPNGFLAKIVPPAAPRNITMPFGKASATARSPPSEPTTPRVGAPPSSPKLVCTARGPASPCWERTSRRCCTTASARRSARDPGRPRDAWTGQGLRPLSAQGHHRGGIGRGPRRRRPRRRTCRARRRPQGNVRLFAVRRQRLRGWPVATIKAGEIVARNGEIVGMPAGRYLLRKAL